MIEIPKPFMTAFPKTLSPKRLAIDALTKLLDMTAIRMVEAATISVGFPRTDSLAIVCVIASTSARPERRPRIV